MKPTQIHIHIQVDEGRAADFLREIANEIEKNETEETTFETSYGIAEITIEE